MAELEPHIDDIGYSAKHNAIIASMMKSNGILPRILHMRAMRNNGIHDLEFDYAEYTHAPA